MEFRARCNLALAYGSHLVALQGRARDPPRARDMSVYRGSVSAVVVPEIERDRHMRPHVHVRLRRLRAYLSRTTTIALHTLTNDRT